MEKVMQKYPLIGVCIIAVILLILGSLTSVLGYQTLEQKPVIQESNSKCDCEKINRATGWHFPVICSILFIPVSILIFLYDLAGNLHLFFLLNIIEKIASPFYHIGEALNCFWITLLLLKTYKKV
jgi:hypothetical protein